MDRAEEEPVRDRRDVLIIWAPKDDAVVARYDAGVEKLLGLIAGLER
jgi:hypothetical protein